MLKDFMLAQKKPAGLMPPAESNAHSGPGPFEGQADDTPPVRAVAAARLGSATCVVSLADGGTDVSTVVHLVHPIEVHATVEADLASGVGPALDMTLPAATVDTRAGAEAISTGAAPAVDKHPRGA